MEYLFKVITYPVNAKEYGKKLKEYLTDLYCDDYNKSGIKGKVTIITIGDKINSSMLV